MSFNSLKNNSDDVIKALKETDKLASKTRSKSKTKSKTKSKSKSKSKTKSKSKSKSKKDTIYPKQMWWFGTLDISELNEEEMGKLISDYSKNIPKFKQLARRNWQDGTDKMFYPM